MLTPRENLLRVLHHQEAEYVPFVITDAAILGFGAGSGPWLEKGPAGGGLDGFGVRWITPASGGGAPIPAPNEFLLKDITEWKRVVQFPDVNAYDWAKDAEQDLAKYDRAQVVIDYGCGNGVFERLAALMGFEEALAAMYEEPEAVNDLLAAITDYKIAFAEKVAAYYKADTFTNYDDIATERNLFMSPVTYRELIKPHHKRLFDAVRNLGMIPVQHTCGKAESVIEDMIEIGAAAWTSVQPANDVAGLLRKYGDKIAFMGGYDTNGLPGRADASDEIVKAEIDRCFAEYAPYKKGYVLFAFRLFDTHDPNAAFGLKPIIEAVMEQRRAGN
jgi:SAM-dependent methyltransferase